MEVQQTCVQCNKKYSNISNLRKHVIKFHPDNEEYLASLQLRKNKHYNFSCDQCNKRFMHLRNLKFHSRTHEGLKDSSAPDITDATTNINQCAMCSNFSADRKTVIEHYREFHSIPIEEKKLSFQSEDEFITWKLTFENDTNCKYVINSQKYLKSHVSTSFICHRSGKYVPEGKNIRHLKIVGSKKINALCPASIKIKELNNGTCDVTIIDKHVGHQNDIGHLNLSKTERENLAVKIASKVPFEDILDEIRDSITDSELKRLHLLTKKDLYNIETSFNLCSSSVRHKNDVLSVESWINEMNSNGDAVLFYKPQGSESEEWPVLKKEDFVLIIMTAAQCEMLKIYGTDCICIDGTHGMNNYDFELITLLIVDDIRQGFPCSFLVSNRSDKEVLKIFFYFVKFRLDTALCPNVFMSDMADAFFNAWIEVMAPPKLRLYCTWHVDQAWRKNISKINTKEKQAFIYKNLRAVLEEREITTFNILINKLYTMLLEDPDTMEFANYFNKYYMCCVECWAYCHRLGAGLNTNMHLERMHKTLKYTYLKGKKVKRLDKAINAIMRFVRDKCIDRLIVLNKGKLCSKLQLIRSRHKKSLNLRKDLVVECENGWNIASETTAELYLIQKIQEDCKCQLLCDECKTCIHQFCCSCLDSSVKYNMCKHIHLLIRYISERVTDTLEQKPEEFDGIPFEEKIKEPNILIIRGIDPCFEENGLHHKTSNYELMRREYFPQLVVRRGQHFKLNITLSRPYDEEKDGLSFIFVVDDEQRPSHGNGTMVGVPLLKKPDRYLPWNVVLHSVNENVITVNVLTPSDTIVAKWRLDIDTRIINGGAYSYSWETRIYILFNPWSKHDQVYIKSEEWREEAVMNDVGIIYRGTYNRIKPVIWKYDQFEKDILDCSLYLVHTIGKIKGNFRSDPVKITRALAAAVNAADDEGAIVGNWSNDHSGGTPPTKWIGSMEILQSYYKKKKPVKFAQCWVFSGVLTTICRALGIPARTVTNYSSAHDTQNSLTVDYFMDEKGAIMEELNSDSIWNFHVWNEAWMTRPDLGKEYSGWQAIDATPQELSEDMYRCGPASVVAVKEGEILRPHDSNFLFAEVNADKIFWRYNGPTQPLKLLRKDIYGIGKHVCTKAAGTFDREDITSTYKYAEKTAEERTTMLKALRQSENLFSRYYLNEDFNDIYFHFNLLDDVKIGQPFDVSLAMRNRSKTINYKVSVILRVDVVTYTGKVGESVKKENFNVTVKPDSTHEVKLTVTYDEYSKRLIDQCSFNISCLASIEDTKFEYYAQDDFRIRKPDIKIVLRDTPIENTEVTADIFVENPLPIPLKKGEFTIEGPGIENKIKLKMKSVLPGEKAKGEFTFTPPRTGTYAVAAKFICKEMDDVDGFVMITVLPKKEQNGHS